MNNVDDDLIKNIDAEIYNDCITRLAKNDPDAGFDLARFFLEKSPCNDPEKILDVVEALMRQSALLGSSTAKEYLDNTWTGMRSIMLKRLKRSFDI